METTVHYFNHLCLFRGLSFVDNCHISGDKLPYLGITLILGNRVVLQFVPEAQTNHNLLHKKTYGYSVENRSFSPTSHAPSVRADFSKRI